VGSEQNEPTPPARRSGRPRSVEADRAIISATLGALVELGYEAISFEAVAARAGVSKTTIYRRWRSKESLVKDALSSLHEKVELPDTGSARDDLVLLIKGFRQRIRSSALGPMTSRLISAAVSTPKLMEIFQATVFAQRRAAARTVLGRGQSRGELPLNLDIDLALDAIIGTIFFRSLFYGWSALDDEDLPAKAVDLVLSS